MLAPHAGRTNGIFPLAPWFILNDGFVERSMFPSPPTILLVASTLFWLPAPALATDPSFPLDLTRHWVGYVGLGVFILAYALVMLEEFTNLRKSKPVMLAAGIIWALIAWVYLQQGEAEMTAQAARHNLLDFAEVFLFLMVAMTYISVLDERNVFEALRSWLLSRGYSYRQLFWLTGILAFVISPLADNLTTALLMGAIVVAIGVDNPRFLAIACVNLVVATNAGGSFSPFGDYTTLMLWQQDLVALWNFPRLFLPALVNFLVPAIIMSFAVPNDAPRPLAGLIRMRRGARRIMILFLLTMVTAVVFDNFLYLPAAVGMMTGLAYLKVFAYYLKRTGEKTRFRDSPEEDFIPFDIFRKLARSEWDTLLFFYGVVLCVGGLGFMGYLALVMEVTQDLMGPTTANILVGILSAFVDNIPVMFAVLNMMPQMSEGQWLLVTLTVGVGGSLLSIGSAAGVSLMGQARGVYTFFSHLRWVPAIALGYAASIVVHLFLNADLL